MTNYNNPKKFKDIYNSMKHCVADLPREHLTFGQRAADKLSSFCGSWRFIIIVLVYIAIWVTLNLIAWKYRWDTWPFIMLNLTLSCLAAMQAPVILMSQNRQKQRERLNQRYDYLINRKAEHMVEKIHNELQGIIKKLDKLKK